MKTYNFKISGMHCEACKKLIEKRVKGIVGVESVVVDVKMGKLEIISNKAITAELVNDVLKGTEYHAQD